MIIPLLRHLPMAMVQNNLAFTITGNSGTHECSSHDYEIVSRQYIEHAYSDAYSCYDFAYLLPRSAMQAQSHGIGDYLDILNELIDI